MNDRTFAAANAGSRQVFLHFWVLACTATRLEAIVGVSTLIGKIQHEPISGFPRDPSIYCTPKKIHEWA